MPGCDTLVHNFLHRTGLLHRFDANHTMQPAGIDMHLLALTVLARREHAAPLFAGILDARIQESATLNNFIVALKIAVILVFIAIGVFGFFVVAIWVVYRVARGIINFSERRPMPV